MNSQSKTACFILLFITTLISLPASAEVAVIVNASNDSTISIDDIKRIYLGKSRTFTNGSPVIAINLGKADQTRQSFESHVLKKSASQVKAYWSKLVFTGKGTPPKEVSSVEEMVKLVKENPAVIGYIDSKFVTSEVKVITKF